MHFVWFQQPQGTVFQNGFLSPVPYETPFESLNKIMSPVSVSPSFALSSKKSNGSAPIGCHFDSRLVASKKGVFSKSLFQHTPNPTLINTFYLLIFHVILCCNRQWIICLFEYSVELCFILKWKQTINTWTLSNPKCHPPDLWSEQVSLCFSNLSNAHFTQGHQAAGKSPF